MLREYAKNLSSEHASVDEQLKSMSDYLNDSSCELKANEGSKQLVFSILASIRCTI